MYLTDEGKRMLVTCHSLTQAKRGAERVYANLSRNSDELWKFQDIDFAKIAQAKGCSCIRVTQPRELKRAIEEALASGKPAVIDIVSNVEGIEPPS